MKNILKRATALLLSLLMVFSVCSTSLIIYATAPDSVTDERVSSKEINYVSIGDSMTNGYGLDGYNGNTGTEDYGTKSYANQFADWLKIAGGATEVNHAQLAMSAMRAEDLHWLLEVDYEKQEVIDAITWLETNGWDESKWYSISNIGDYYTWNELVNDYRFDVAAYCIEGKDKTDGGAFNDVDNNGYKIAYETYSDVEALQIVAEYYQTAVEKADIISLGIGNGNFGVFMFGRIMEAIGFGAEEGENTAEKAMIYDINNVLAQCGELRPQMETLLEDVNVILAEYGFTPDTDGVITTNEALYNTLVYAILSYALNYAGSVEAILQLNPYAEIIQVALMNTVEGNASEDDGVDNDEPTLGDLMNMLLVPMNVYLAALPTYMQVTNHNVYADAKFYFAEADYVECIVDTYAKGKLSDIVQDRFIQSIVYNYDKNEIGMVWGMVTGMFNGLLQDKLNGTGINLELVKVSLNDVNAYEEGDYSELSADTVFSCAIYKAFEDAIIEGKNASAYISAILGLGSLDGLFDGVAASLMTGLNFTEIMKAVTSSVKAAGAADVSAWASTEAGQNTINAYSSTLVANGIKDSEQIAQCCYALGNGWIEVDKLSVDAVTEALTTHFTINHGANCAAPVLGEAIAELLTPALVNDPTISGLLALFARCIIGNGIGSHPSEDGYLALTLAVWDAYINKKTSESKTDENIGFEDMPVVKKIVSDLTAQGYLNDDQILDIAFEVYANYKANNGNINLFAVIDKVYNVLFQIEPDNLDDAQRLEIIGIIYFDLKNAEEGYLKAYDKYLPTLEELVEKLVPYVTAEQAFDIVEKAYGMTGAESDAGSQISDAEQDALVDYVYTMLIKENDPEKATAIIEVVYSVLKKNGYLSGMGNEAALIEALCKELDPYVTDEEAVLIANCVYEQVMSSEGINTVAIAEYVYDLLIKNNDDPAEATAIIRTVYDVLKANGSFAVDESDLALLEALCKELDPYVEDKEAVLIANYVFGQAIISDDIDKAAIAEFIYDLLIKNNEDAAEATAIIRVVYGVLKDHGYLEDYADKTALLEDLCAVLDPYYTDAQAISVANYIYESMDDLDVMKIALDLYANYLLTVEKVDDRIDIICKVCAVLNKHYNLKADKTVAMLDSIGRSLVYGENAPVSKLHAFAIIHFVYLAYVNDNKIDDSEFRLIANIIYYGILGTPKMTRSGGGSIIDFTNPTFTWDELKAAYTTGGTVDVEQLTKDVSKAVGNDENVETSAKVAIIQTVYSGLKEDGVVEENSEVAAVGDLMMTLTGGNGGDKLLEDKQIEAILDSAFENLVAPDPEKVDTNEAITNITQTLVEELVGMDPKKFDEVMDAVNKTLEDLNKSEGGEGTGSIVIPEITIPEEVTIANKLAYVLAEEKLLNPEQRGKLVEELMTVIMGGDIGDPIDLVDKLYGIFYDKGFSVEKTVKLVIVVTSFVYEEGLADPYYAQAMKAVLTDENIDIALDSIASSKDALNAAIVALGGEKKTKSAIETDTTKLKAALVAELGATWDTLDKIEEVLNNLDQLKGNIANGDKTNDYEIQAAVAVLLTFESNLYAHAKNIAAIAYEAGKLADPYILAVIDTVNYYAGIAADRAQAAYDWCVANVQGFVANYIAFVDMVAAEAAKIDPALGTAVRDFMINTPADTFNLIALYGDKAAKQLYLEASEASKDIYSAVAILVDLFVKNGKKIYGIVMTSDAYLALLAEIEQITEELINIAADIAKAPAAQSSAYMARYEELNAQLKILYGELYDVALVAIENVDPALAAELRDTIGAIATIISTASGEYGNFFVANAAELGGMIVSAFLQNWNEFAGVAAPIFIAIGHSIEEYVGGIAHDVRVQIEYQLDILEEELKKLNAQLQYATGEIDKHIIEKIDLINTKIDELRKILDDGLRDNIIRAGQLVKELGEDVYDLAIALKDASLEAASKAFAKIAADLAELDKVVTEVLGKQYTALKEQLGEFAVKLFNNLINTALALVPELDKQLYDYFYNNPEEVIAFFHEYSDEIAEFASLYGEETLGVIVIALAAAGPYVAEYIMENPESALAGLTAWADKYGDRILAILDVYDDYCPVHNAVKEEIAKLQAELIVLNGQLIELNKQLQTATGAAIDAINAEIAKVQAEIARVQAKINALIEKLQNLDDAVAQLNAALKLFAANAYEAAAKAVLEAVTNLDKAIQEILSDVSNEVAEQLKQLLKDGKELTIELLKDLADLILETAVKYAPIVDEELYNYFYNNPEEVIAFFNEYGDDIIDLCEEYGDYALVLVGAALVYYGDDLAAYIINNPETVLAGLTAWADKYGDRVAALLQVYADALGVCDAVRAERDALYAELAALQAKLEALNAQLQTATGKAREIILAEIAKAQAEIARVQAKIAELNAKLQNLVNAIYNLDAALKQFVDNSLDTATAAVIVAIDNLNKAIKDLMDSVSDDVAAKLEQLLNTGMGLTLDLLADLADLAVEAVSKYAPELDAYLYNYFLNNADEVIAFFNEYGDKIIELCEKYGDKALAVIAIALASCGRELAEYIVNNSEALLAGMAEWVEIYGDKIVAMLQAYAEALGLCDAVREEIAILNNKLSALQAELMNQINILQNQFQVELNALYAQLKDATEAQKAIILEKIKEIEFKIELIQQYIAELQAQIVALQAKIAELNAKLQALVIALQNLDDTLMALLEVGVEAGVAAVQNAISEVAKAITDLAGVISDNIAAQIDKLLQKAKDYLNGAYNSAILVDYIINNQSSYLAFGDDELAAKILEAYLKNYVADANVGYAYKDATVVTSNKITDILNPENLKLVAESDLISLGYSFNKIANDTVRAAIEYLMYGEPTVPTNFDWVGLVGAEAAVEVEKLLDEVYAAMLDAGLDATIPEEIGYPVKIADIVMTAVEYFAYIAIEYAVYLPKVVGAINQINPDAVIMINAISNPIAGAKISFAGQEFVFGDYLNYVCDAIYVENIVLATMYENVVFVPTTEIETSFTDRVITLDTLELFALYTDLLDGKAIVTTKNGSAYTAVKMQEALNIIVRPSALLGDVNHDGIVDYVDAIFILEYDAMLPVNIDLTVADVDGNGIVDYNDAIWVLEYDAMLIDKFPAEN